MAHEVETMFSAVETPWHRLGVVTTEALSAAEAIVTAGLDWKVEMVPLYTQEHVNGEAVFLPSDEGVATRRNDNGRILGHVGTDYRPIQNAELFSFADVLLDQGDLRFETAGSLRGGKVVWCLAQVAREVVIDGDQHVPYLLLASSHDGTMALHGGLTPTRVVCMNTLNLALGRTIQNTFKIRHTSGADRKVNEARRALGISYAYLDGFEVEVEKLMNQPVTDAMMEAIVLDVLPESDSKRAETRREPERNIIRELWYDKAGNVGRFHGTGWGAIQAVSEWEQWHKRIPRKADRDTVLCSRVLRGDHLEATTEVHKALQAIR